MAQFEGYNAIALGKAASGAIIFRYQVQLNEAGKILFVAGFTAPEEGTEAFDEVFRRSRPRFVKSLEIRREDPRAFMERENEQGLRERLGAGPRRSPRGKRRGGR